MSLLWVLGGLALGIAVGSVSGLIGLGGGVFLIPALTYFYGMSQKRAQGTSIATLLLPVGALAFWSYYKQGHADLKLALFIAVGFTIGGWFGGQYAQHLSDTALRRGFAVLLVALAIKLFMQR
ncbi:putative permease [Terriglobus roseus DSM 18391]|uniref:Probable membrane transporter protein n=1 Tax=Terriglobus roseus (strain DSM 18391 / NRRL B-41598 / KBS 63) TaxID=926566 RepID=I3ZDQ9_TERRK|nr:sulfite exporter TauE/SafE family protein [Terriglobus roseus]AFL87377.1 putative permease [Terriglobus roseus DSM 18391]